jgi:hypothetical protein
VERLGELAVFILGEGRYFPGGLADAGFQLKFFACPLQFVFEFLDAGLEGFRLVIRDTRVSLSRQRPRRLLRLPRVCQPPKPLGIPYAPR